ncbi:hypothetical protein R1sor_012970 [Riccia sorocarpa]|uniref:CBS domain-containing protein n=1 Tax=Riccia sorocarpa TaxID=122646 RepID=A0ABD3I8P7_9MARC
MALQVGAEDGTTVADACRRMATRRVDAALLTDASAILCGTVTDKDVATRVTAEGLKPEETSVSRVMTNPTCVMGDTLVVDALQKMVQGKFRHLPVVENGEVVVLLDITKCRVGHYQLEKLEMEQKAEEEEDTSWMLSMKRSNEKAKSGAHC